MERLTWGIENILHHMDHTVRCHQVTGRHIHGVDLDSVVDLWRARHYCSQLISGVVLRTHKGSLMKGLEVK